MFLDGERKKSCTTLSARSLTLRSFTFELSPLRPHHFNIGDVQSVCPRGALGGAGFFPFQGCILGLVFQAILKCRGGGNRIFYPTGKTNCPQNGAGFFPLTVRFLGLIRNNKAFVFTSKTGNTHPLIRRKPSKSYCIQRGPSESSRGLARAAEGW